ncbi:hypothetical protein ACA910_007959 [Epithemia clementina (nom. ined.)]
MSNITATCIDSMSMDADAEDQAALRRLDRRASSLVPTSVFRAQFQLSKPVGLTLVQVDRGRQISQVELDLDRIFGGDSHSATANGNEVDRQRMDWSTIAAGMDKNFKGLLVSSVVKNSAAWEVGVRAGDILTSSSATLGGALWPTSTLDGIQSSLQGRKFTSSFVSFEFCRVSDQFENVYQLTLKRPLGIEVQETQDGYVVVTGFNDAAPRLVRRAVQPGDRVLAVDSSLGGAMWPVTTVAGLTSACTSRMPGAEITLQLQRPLENMQTAVEYSKTQGIASPVVEKDVSPVDTIAEKSAEKKALIKRCRSVLDRYSVKGDNKVMGGFKDKYDVPAIVADKVVDALASAGVTLDSMTLSMIMRAYLSCNQPDSALKVFEAATGFRSDGTCFNVAESLIGDNAKGFVPTESALNLYTGTALLQAHAMKDDLYSISRVLASLEGRSGVMVNGLESAPWPFTGVYGSIKPDTQCYNIAMAAAARAGGAEGLELALEWFSSMTNAARASDEKPERNVVSYNTIISALSAAGRSVEAFRIFDRMRQSKVRPDKYTYTPLIKACANDGDLQELLYDMKENNIKLDTVTYNAMIRFLCEKRKWTEASKLVTEMESRGVQPDSRTYGNLMSALLKADKPTACLTLFESASASSKTSSITENVHLYTTAITAASVLGDFERAIELLSRMAVKGVKPNLKTLTSVVGACIAAKKFDLAVQVYQKIDNPDGYAMCQGIEALTKNGQWTNAFDILQRQTNNRRSRVMTGQQIMKSYGTILSACLRARDFQSSEAVFSHLMRQGNIPNKKMLQDVVEVFGFRDARGITSFAIESADEKLSVFRFMLFILDSLRARKLPVDSYIYSVTLFLGSVLDGKAKLVASLLAQSKVSQGAQQLIASVGAASSPSSTSSVMTTLNGGLVLDSSFNPAKRWVDIFDHVDSDGIQSLKETGALPSVAVRMSERDRRRVIRAEKDVLVTPRKYRKRSKNSQVEVW